MTVRNQTAHQIDDKVVDTAMAGVLDLRNVLQLVEHGLDDRPLTQQQFIGQWEQPVLHVGLEFGNQLHAKRVEQLLK